MSTVTASSLKNDLTSWLRRAQQGERVIVVLDGAPVAELGPPGPHLSEGEDAALARMAEAGRITLPEARRRPGFGHPRIPARGKTTAEMVIEDR